MYLLGFDIGSSSIKASLLDAATGKLAAAAYSPQTEMGMIVERPGWAEQDPEEWWRHVRIATALIREKSGVNPGDIAAVGISYQMHGLVLVDKAHKVLRPAIIWCDSRAVGIGEKAAAGIGGKKCLTKLLNYPGNFTASKLRWVIENEPELYRRAHKFMLPGDYIAMRMTGEIVTTVPGLAEGILWDYEKRAKAVIVLDEYGIDPALLPDIVPTFSVQGELTKAAAEELGLSAGTKIAYRAGDQPNNAFSLNVLDPGEVATTAGTSGVVFGITDKDVYDPGCRVNTFVHVTDTEKKPRNGVMVCVNGTGILYSWLKKNTAGALDYAAMNERAMAAPPGSDGLLILPYGNGAERTLENRNLGASLHGLDFNVHGQSQLFRAAQEGIVFALQYGLKVMKGVGMRLRRARAGHANMFLSSVFREIFVNTTGLTLELYDTDGSRGAARGAGLGAGVYGNTVEAFTGLEKIATVEPDRRTAGCYAEIYGRWEKVLTDYRRL